MLKFIKSSCDPSFLYCYFSDENDNYYYWRTTSTKVKNALNDSSKKFKALEYEKDKTNERKFYNNKWHSRITVKKWEITNS